MHMLAPRPWAQRRCRPAVPAAPAHAPASQHLPLPIHVGKSRQASRLQAADNGTSACIFRTAVWNVNGMGQKTGKAKWEAIAELAYGVHVLSLQECFGGARSAHQMAQQVQKALISVGADEQLRVECSDKQDRYWLQGQGLVTITNNKPYGGACGSDAVTVARSIRDTLGLPLSDQPQLLATLQDMDGVPLLCLNVYLPRRPKSIHQAQIRSLELSIVRLMEEVEMKCGVKPCLFISGDLNATLDRASMKERETMGPADCKQASLDLDSISRKPRHVWLPSSVSLGDAHSSTASGAYLLLSMMGRLGCAFTTGREHGDYNEPTSTHGDRRCIHTAASAFLLQVRTPGAACFMWVAYRDAAKQPFSSSVLLQRLACVACWHCHRKKICLQQACLPPRITAVNALSAASACLLGPAAPVSLPKVDIHSMKFSSSKLCSGFSQIKALLCSRETSGGGDA
eukprot:353171-Chlamydomonas_euryale.AAC.8